MICQFQIYIVKKIKLRKNSSFNWFTPFHVLIRPDVIWKKVSRLLYHVHFTVIHTNSRHKFFMWLFDINLTKLLKKLSSCYDSRRHEYDVSWILKI